ncbi:MAG: hypothetical protein LBT62_06900, partial [Deltaproteobacteria bacterium]|nr:hypothetical protein [Deltaproteobacteria bacterium]
MVAAADQNGTASSVNNRRFNLREEPMDKRLTAAYCRTALADELAIRAQERRIREYAGKRNCGELTFYR